MVGTAGSTVSESLSRAREVLEQKQHKISDLEHELAEKKEGKEIEIETKKADERIAELEEELKNFQVRFESLRLMLARSRAWRISLLSEDNG